jgi:hypothetical protein
LKAVRMIESVSVLQYALSEIPKVVRLVIDRINMVRVDLAAMFSAKPLGHPFARQQASYLINTPLRLYRQFI